MSDSSNSGSEFLADVELPVVFTPADGTAAKTFTRQPDGQGGEGIGVWRDGIRAWKLFATQNTYDRTKGYYDTAIAKSLPIGNLDPVFKKGKVKQGNRAATDGFALITGWLDGTEFNFQGRQFATALATEKISHSRSSVQYKRILAGCQTALDIHLNDVQGKVNGSGPEYIAFFDVHTTPSGTQAEALLEVLRDWGTSP
ncbi:hypothetical protein BJV74DRAFT_887864 [Russula compacta]|nr:hypothetical protein BJV74DRAFT_887864 [Russula compacta]